MSSGFSGFDFLGVFAMEPAYPILLNKDQLALLGELTVILGQVEEIMVRTVAMILTIDRGAANRIMGSSKTADNMGIWYEIVRSRGPRKQEAANFAKHATIEAQKVAQGRNDFIHAWFEHSGGYVEPGYVEPGYVEEGELTARRIRAEKTRPVSELEAVRDWAIRLSNLVAHVEYLASPGHSGPSPWLERLDPSLPPRQRPDEAPHSSKSRKDPP